MERIQSGQASSSILVVEDNAAQLKTLTDILETEGLQPIGCLSGRAALELCQQYNVYVAILELKLADMDGLEVLRQLKELKPEMRVIIHTAYATLESAMEAVNKKAFAYVQKMGNVEELLTAVHRAFHAHFAGYSERLEWEVRKQMAELVEANDALRQEVAEHEHTEKALQESEENFRALIENANDGIVIATGKGFHVYANKRAAEITNYDVAELLKMSIKDLVRPDKFKMVMERYTKRLRGEAITNQYEAVFLGKDGHSIPVELSAAKTVWQGQSASMIVIRDITERKQAEEALQKANDELERRVRERTADLQIANAELSHASRLKDEFLATMSHEFRTPLNVILGMTEVLHEGIQGPLNPKQLTSLRKIKESGHHLLTLVNDILDLSRIVTGTSELQNSVVDVGLVCQAVLRTIEQNARKKHLKISSLFDNAVIHIRIDGQRLKQILVHLLNNAIKFTPEGGEIGLHVRGEPEQCAVHFTVWDTGIGIAPEDMKRLFQPFVQLDASLSRKYEGAGLGLSLAYRIIEMHGGSISVESEKGNGSRFTVSLPWREPGKEESNDLGPSHAPSSHPPASTPPQSVTVLIAEDRVGTSKILSTELTLQGYHVIIARNGWEAFALAKEHTPDLIVMDIQMPEMDGLEAIQHIRSDTRGKSIPIIALTALAIPGDREQCLSAGADEYLIKPVNPQKLSELLEKLILKNGNC